MPNAATLKSLKPQIPQPASAAIRTVGSARAFAMLSHRGRVRQANQDACAALPEHGAFVVCDGMGGAAGGEVASHLATEAFLDSLSRARRGPSRATSNASSASAQAGSSYPPNHPHTRLQQAICSANHAVFQRAQRSRTLRGMGTTLVSLLWDDTPATPTLWVAHVGDSRCYLLRRGALQQLTSDHSLVEEQVRAGLLDRAQAANSPIRNIITRAIGSQPSVDAEIAAHTPESGDLYLLASDGLTRELNDAQITLILASAAPATLEPACQALIDAANKMGGHDNITVLLVACP
jgi:protein phosphatase